MAVPADSNGPKTTDALAVSSETLRQYLETHRFVWDMPSMCEIYPHVVEHVNARYDVTRDGSTIVVRRRSDPTGTPEVFKVADSRYVVDVLLRRDFKAALIRERTSSLTRVRRDFFEQQRSTLASNSPTTADGASGDPLDLPVAALDDVEPGWDPSGDFD